MQYRLMFSFFLLCSFFPALSGQAEKVVGYLQYGRGYMLDELQFDKLTHLCIAFANPDEKGRLQTGGVDIGPIVKRAKAANVKVLISVAGGALEPEWAAAWKTYMQPWNRQYFVNEMMNYVRRHQLDGVDVDLEWKHVDHHYSPFVLALGRALHAEGKLITAALPGKKRYKHITDQALGILDFINIMAYDLTGPWEPTRSGPHSPYTFAESCLSYWKKQGVESSKLVLGLPFYGWDFTNRERIRSVNYGVIVDRNPAFAHLDQVGQLYFNGLVTITAKTELALQHAGGVMLWELGRDALNEYSLLEAVSRVMRGDTTLMPAPQPVVEATVQKEEKIVALPTDQQRKTAARFIGPMMPPDTVDADFGEAPLAEERADPYRLDLEVAPNPFVDTITIVNHEQGPIHLVLTNEKGQILFESDVQPNSTLTWETSSFPHGYYTFSAMVGGRQLSRRLIKRIPTNKPLQGVQSKGGVLQNWPQH
ncbi:MAG: glycosyl hydrolase family 18 protein [Phaeodactylibacter sp.]|uniref:glycosyl hydrolase family 18 protein n=1 Tax=Phaeodactylibacter sp. TaxID=1940289 RepID=UPI0032ED83C9